MHLVNLRGYTPSNRILKGRSYWPLLRHRTVRPKNVAEKNHMMCACSAWAAGVLPTRRNCSWDRFGHVGAPAVGPFCLYPRMARKPAGIPPLGNFPLKKYRWNCEHEEYALVNTAYTYENKMKHRGCHKGQRVKRWYCYCTATASFVSTVAARILLTSRVKVPSYRRPAPQHAIMFTRLTHAHTVRGCHKRKSLMCNCCCFVATTYLSRASGAV